MWAWFCPGLKGVILSAFLPAKLSQTWSVGSCLPLQRWWSCLVRYTLALLSPRPTSRCHWHQTSEWASSGSSTGRQLAQKPSLLLLCLLHPKKAQILQLLQGRIGSQQGRLRAIWIAMEVQSIFWSLLMHRRLFKRSSNPAVSFLKQFESVLVLLPPLH